MGTSKSKGQQEDLHHVIDVFSKIDKLFLPQSIRDHHYLGKFKQALPRTRPILVKLNRTADVYSLLPKRRSVTSLLIIKPDMTHQQRSSESFLLSERWSLIQSNVDFSSIKIWNNKYILVNHKLHAEIIDNKLIQSPIASTSDLSLPSRRTASDTFSPDPDSNLSLTSSTSRLSSCPPHLSTSFSCTPSTASVGSCPQGGDWLDNSIHACFFNSRSLVKKLTKFQYLGPITFPDLYQWPPFCCLIFWTTLVHRWHQMFQMYPESWWLY